MRIRRVTLATADVAAQALFWGQQLGLRVQDDGDGAAIEVSLRRSVVRFEQAEGGADPRYHFAFNIPPGSIEDAHAWIEERHEVLAFHDDPEVEEGATIVRTDRGASTFYFLDAAGNVAELIANSHLDDGFEEPFGPQSFLEIAEIGIATDDTEATRAAIRRTFDAAILWGGEEGSLLTAIGDDHGVVIVAPVGRGWIPVGLRARPLPTTIVAEATHAGEVVLPEGPYHLRAI